MTKTQEQALLAAGYPADYLEALERELEGYRRRQVELRSLGVREEEGALRDAVSGEEAVKSELQRLGHGQQAAAKRPRAPQAEKRSAVEAPAKKQTPTNGRRKRAKK
jgi:hypothetical protein